MVGQEHPPPDGGKQQPLGDEPSGSVWDDAATGKKATTAAPGLGSKYLSEVPATLRPGPAALNFGDDDDGNVWDEARQQSFGTKELERVPEALLPGGRKPQTNPFMRRKPVPQRSDAAPVESSFARLDLDEADQSKNPWRRPADSQSATPTPQPQKTLLDGSEGDPWASSHVSVAPASLAPAAASPAVMSLPSEDEPMWEDDARPGKGKTPSETPPATAMSDELMEDQHVWDDLGSLDRGKGKVLDLPAAQQAQLDDWNLVDADPSPDPPKPSADEAGGSDRPPLPPRGESSRPKWVPSRRPVDGQSETYQVKKIRWHDHTSASNPRTSPILIQNNNGPCPLVALVNALTLTTPADIPETTLVQVLRSREQVSLNLILDAVFDELMSPRRTTSDDALPDVSDLYAFLQSLHTGMNVNPHFVPTAEMMTAYKHTSLTHLDPAQRGDFIPGTFENTMEMSLYATFSIPLIHGWLPSRSDPAYEALERRAASYEEVQNLLFHEEELEDKLSNPSGGLSDTEQKLCQDIMTIKLFLRESATQLTSWGIEVIAKAMRPGTFAILFRNDHFSTLYCHPRTAQLLSLVTDAGYGGHEEVVWESLVDVNGERTEYLSGDFGVVSAGEAAPRGTPSSAGASASRGQWTTEQDKRGKGRARDETSPNEASPKHEQEDRDLALALQLQEEEDQRHREEQARRRQESILSEQYIEKQAHRPKPVARPSRRATPSSSMGPDRRGSSGVGLGLGAATGNPHARQSTEPTQQVPVPPLRPGVNRRPEGSGEEAPPSYEQAAKAPAYVPPAGHGTHAGSSNQAASDGVDGQGVARPQRPAPSGGRGRPVSPGAALGSTSGGGRSGRERECVLM